MNADQYDDAVEPFRQIVRNNPRGCQVFARMGLIDQQMERTKDAQRNIGTAFFVDLASLTVIHDAGTVLLSEGSEEDAYRYFQQAFDVVKNKNYSYAYYFVVYLRYYLPSDLVPQTQRGGLTPEMVDSFILLAQHNDKNRQPSSSSEILKRIEIETSSLLASETIKKGLISLLTREPGLDQAYLA